MHHHGHGILHGAEWRRQDRFLLDDGFLHPHNIGKEHHLFLHHVRSEFLRDSLKAGADLLQLRMVLAMYRADFVEQRSQPCDLLACVLVVRAVDVGNQISQRLRLPVVVFLFGPCCLLRQFKGIQYLIYRQVRSSTRLFQRFVSAAAVIDPESLEYASGFGEFHRHLAYRLCSAHAHDVSPRSPLAFASLLRCDTIEAGGRER